MCIPAAPSGLFVPLSCPNCGGDVEMVTTSRVASFSAKACVRCCECRREVLVSVSLAAGPVRPDAEKNRNHMRKVRANA